jgi:hypothetical protein
LICFFKTKISRADSGLSSLATRLNKVKEKDTSSFNIYFCTTAVAMKKIRIAQSMMIGTIVLIAAFQVYWLVKLYNDEWEGLKKETDVIFRETVYKLQVARFKKDTLTFRRFSNGLPDDNLFNLEAISVVRNRKTEGSSSADRSRTKGANKPARIVVAASPDFLEERKLDDLLKGKQFPLSEIQQTQLLIGKSRVQPGKNSTRFRKFFN